MNISVINTDEFKNYIFYLRIFNSIIYSCFFIPIILYVIYSINVMNNLKECFAYMLCSLLLYGIPAITIVGYINDELIDNSKIENAITLLLTIIFSPSIILLEPIFILCYYLKNGKKYKLNKLYKMIQEIE